MRDLETEDDEVELMEKWVSFALLLCLWPGESV